MSKICEKCGNVLPEGTDICPNCGREAFDDLDLQSTLDELGLDLEGDLPVDASDEDGSINLDEPTIRIPVVGKDDGKEPEAPEAADASIHKLIEDAQPKQNSKSGAAAKKKKQPEGTKKRPSGTKPAAGQKKPVQKQSAQKQQRSAAAIGIAIGLIIALLIIGCGAAFLLYQMGFFVCMTDEELLQTSTTEPVEETQQVPTEPPAVSEEVPAAEETEAPVEFSNFEDSAEETVEPEEVIECTKFNITGTEYIILYSRGVTTELTYVIEPSELRSKIQWESSDETIATVDETGTIRARRGGECAITGTCGDKSIKAYVTCDFTVPSTILDMNMEDITMTYEGQTAELAIDYELTDEQIEATVWESSDTAVATVDKNGVVTAVANGTAIVTASIGEYTASCIVRCVGVTGNRGYNSDESEYVINYEDVTLTRKGEYFQLTLKSVLGKEVPAFTWESDDTSVATVDSKGIVTAVADGTAYITTSVGSDKFQCIVRVSISD